MSMIIIHNFVLHKLLLFGNFSWSVIDFQVKRLFNGKSFQRVCGNAKLLPEITLKLCVHTTTTLQQKRCQMTVSNLVSALIHILHCLKARHPLKQNKQENKLTNKIQENRYPCYTGLLFVFSKFWNNLSDNLTCFSTNQIQQCVDKYCTYPNRLIVEI